jgi:uncharacterized membrane protein YdbT with pleckstrin-like domain
MTGKSNSALQSFMKKQITEKSTKKNLIEQSIFSDKEDKSGDENKKDEEKEKLNEEEEKEKKELEDAKQASRSKASQMDQTEMLKKLIVQNAVKFILIIGSMLALAYGIIEVGPKLFSSLNGALINTILKQGR